MCQSLGQWVMSWSDASCWPSGVELEGHKHSTEFFNKRDENRSRIDLCIPLTACEREARSLLRITPSQVRCSMFRDFRFVGKKGDEVTEGKITPLWGGKNVMVGWWEMRVTWHVKRDDESCREKGECSMAKRTLNFNWSCVGLGTVL